MKCTTCGTNLISEERFTRFSCPSCRETEIVRCESCRVKKIGYKCEKCGFTGP